MRLPVAHSISSVKAPRSNVYVTSAKQRPRVAKSNMGQIKEEAVPCFWYWHHSDLVEFLGDMCPPVPLRANQ